MATATEASSHSSKFLEQQKRMLIDGECHPPPRPSPLRPDGQTRRAACTVSSTRES